MQAQLHKKYDLRSSRKRTRGQKQNEGSISREQTPPSLASKGKKPLEESVPHKATASTFTKQEYDHPKEKKPTSIPLKLPDPPKEQFKEAITEKGLTPLISKKNDPWWFLDRM